MLIVLTLDHHHSSVADRERFMLDPGAQHRLGRLVRLGCGGQVAFLVTCNRVEIISDVEADDRAEAIGRLAEFARRVAPELAAGFLDRAACLTGDAAARHLFRVAAGLESQIPGDVQILGQFRTAYASTAAAGTAGPELHRLMQSALRVAKRVHTETDIGRRSASVGGMAATQIVEHLPPGAPRRRVLLLGAGKTAERAAAVLASFGCSLTVCNRNRERAESLAQRAGALVIPFEDRYTSAAFADAMLVTTAATEPTLVAGPLQQARHRAGRDTNSLIVTDLGVPRNVDPEVARLGGVTLLGLESVTHDCQGGVHPTQWRAAERIIETELHTFWAWIGARPARRAMVA